MIPGVNKNLIFCELFFLQNYVYYEMNYLDLFVLILINIIFTKL